MGQIMMPLGNILGAYCYLYLRCMLPHLIAEVEFLFLTIVHCCFWLMLLQELCTYCDSY